MSVMKPTDERYETLVDLLVMGTPRTQVAKYFGVHIATSRRWLACPKLKAEVRRRQAKMREGLSDVVASRERSKARALEALADLACDVSMPGEVRLKAAQEVMGWFKAGGEDEGA